FTLTVTNAAGSSTATATVEVTDAASVLELSAERELVTVGQTAQLHVLYVGTSASLDHGIGAVESGETVETGALDGDTTFTLTVQAPLHSAPAPTPTRPVPAASITSFDAHPLTVSAGGTTELRAVFSGGVGVLAPGDVELTSDEALST